MFLWRCWPRWGATRFRSNNRGTETAPNTGPVVYPACHRQRGTNRSSSTGRIPHYEQQSAGWPDRLVVRTFLLSNFVEVTTTERSISVVYSISSYKVQYSTSTCELCCCGDIESRTTFHPYLHDQPVYTPCMLNGFRLNYLFYKS